MSKEEITATFSILLVAGSETTATLLSAVTFYLLKYPKVMDKLRNEVRTTFQNEDEITQISVNKLKYLFAVLEEGMRMHPPAPRGGPRVVPESGATVDGIWIPGGVYHNYYFSIFTH
jgi:cytochrome P450